MKPTRTIVPISLRSLAMLALALNAMSPAAALPKGASPAYVEVAAVANSTELSTTEKVARLREFIRRDETRQTAFYQLDLIDPAAARDEVLALFRAAGTPRRTKLWAGHLLLERGRPQQNGFPKEFAAEFAKYLISAILDGGEAEFFEKQDGTVPTAVGEYAYLGSSFDGYKDIDFAPFKDPRVVPVLIRCLDAPDHVFAEEQGCVVMGKPGEPSGRNTARQQIPVALAKLGDARAIAPLEKVLFTHADINERMNAAYALARLLDKQEDRAAIGRKLLADEALVWCRFPFAKGMIEAGDDAGVAFLSLKHVGETPGRPMLPMEIFYHLNQRLALLQDFKSPKVEDFIREILDYQPWLDLVLFTPGSVKVDALMDPRPPKDEAEALERSAPNIIATYTTLLKCVKEHRMTSLTGKLQAIAKDSNETIRRMTEECVKELGK